MDCVSNFQAENSCDREQLDVDVKNKVAYKKSVYSLIFTLQVGLTDLPKKFLFGSMKAL